MNKVLDEIDFLYADKHQKFAQAQLCFFFVHFKDMTLR